MSKIKNQKSKIFLLAIGYWLLAFGAEAAEVKEIQANGVKAWLVEDHLLPIVSIKLAFKGAGNAYDPDGKEGLGFEVSSMLNEGAGVYTSQEYQKLMEENAIGFVPELDKDNFYISIKTLTESLPLAADLTNIAITSPKFAPEDYERIKGQSLSMVRKRAEQSGAVAEEEFDKIMFQGHPYAKQKEGDVASLEAITPEDLHNFASAKFAKDNMLVTIVGDIDAAGAEKILATLTKGLQEKAQIAALPEFTGFPKGRLAKLKMANPQTYVLFGEAGIKRNDPDYYAAYILNNIFGGGGFSARLMTEVREKNGLAYTVGTSLESFDKTDLFSGAVSTKAASVDKSIKIIREEYKKIATNGVTADELRNAVDYITGSFGLNLDKNENLASFLMVMRIHNLGRDYLDNRNNYFRNVTLDQINAVAKRMVNAENLVFVRVGQ